MASGRSTRRQFLAKSACVGGAGLVVPYIWTSSQAKAQSANDGFGVLSVGVRGRGGGVGRSAGKFGRVIACCDVDTTSADSFVKKLGAQVEDPVPLPGSSRSPPAPSW